MEAIIGRQAAAGAAEKIGICGLDLYYGQFRALKQVDMAIRENEITAFIGPIRLRQEHAASDAQPHERPHRGLPHHRQRDARRGGRLRRHGRKPAAAARGHGVPKAQPVPHEHL